MSRFSKILVPSLVILIVSTWFLVKDDQIAGEPGWPPGIHRTSNALDILKVKDTDSGTTLFWYHSDPDAHPIRVEKQDAHHWSFTISSYALTIPLATEFGSKPPGMPGEPMAVTSAPTFTVAGSTIFK